MQASLLNSNKGSLFAIAIHVAVVIGIYFIFTFFGFITGWPQNEELVQWDGGWYLDIAQNGYSFGEGEQSNTAFFPLFPLIWRYTHFSPTMMSLFNFIFFLIGLHFLKKTFRLNNLEFLFLLSVPGFFYCYVPFSEAIFFLSGSMIVYGLKRHFNLALLGIFLAGMTRSVSFFFIPIILFSMLYAYGLKGSRPGLIKKTLLMILTSVFSLFTAQFLQFLESGTFFTIFETQKQFSRVLSFPELYFTTWDGARLIWLDGLAFFIGILSIVLCAKFFIQRFLKNKKPISSVFLFSLAYLALTTLTVIFYSPKDDVGGTSLMSFNRYIFASPFFAVFLIMHARYSKMTKSALSIFVFTFICVALSLNIQGYFPQLEHFALPVFKTKLYFGAMFAYALAFLALSNKILKPHLWPALYMFNVMVQVYLLNVFVNGIWVG